LLLNAEIKSGEEPSEAKITEAVRILVAFKKGVPVVRRSS